MNMPLAILNRRRRGFTAFSPSALFALAEPGVWYDPSDVANLAWRRNLLTYSEQFDNAAWAKTNATVTANAGVAPDGTTTADKLINTSATASHYVSQLDIPAGTYSWSCHMKAAEFSRGAIYLFDGGLNLSAVFDLSSGTVSSSGSAATASIVSVGDGWYRCRVSGTVAPSGGGGIRISANMGGAFNESTAGNGTSGILIWGAQLELGSTATDYQRITDVNTEVIERFPTATLYQDTIGTIPVTTPGQAVALMLDKSRGLTLGAELIANGDFSSPTTTGWAAGGATLPTLSVVSGELSINTTTGSNFPGASYAFTTVVGRTYRVTLTARTNTTNASSVYIRDSGGNHITSLPSIGASATAYNFVFVARQTSSNIYIFEFIGSAGTGTIFADNISVRELPGAHATQATAASRPIYGVVPQGGRRNLLLNTDTLATQSVTVTAVPHTLSFYGTGTVTLTGVSTAGPLVGTGAGNRVYLEFTPTAGSLTLTVSGSVTFAQLERD